LQAAGEALNVPPRPVFYEELDMLGMDHRGWTYPKSDAPLLWACDRRYFYCGVLVMEVKGGNIYDDPEIVLTPEGQNIILTHIDINKLRDTNSDTMFLIEHEAMEFINSTYRRYKGITKVSKVNANIDFQTLATRQEKRTGEKHVVVKEDCDSFDIMEESEANAQGKSAVLTSKIDEVVVSFSGGKDSQVLLDIVSRVIPNNDFTVVYSDTGYELPTSLALYDVTKNYYTKKYPKLKFYIAKNKQPLMFYWDNLGSPSRIHRWCCSVMKSAPLAKTLKEISGKNKQPQVLLFDGVRAEESVNRASRSRIGKNVKHNNMINVSPILEWNSTEVYLYIFMYGLPFNESYRRGLSRVGCVVCPYSSGWSEDLCGKLYPETIEPFVGWIRNNLTANKVEGIENYIKTGRWKMRAGGRDLKVSSTITFVAVNPVFKAVVHAPKESLMMWLRVLGNYSYTQDGDNIKGKIKYQGNVHSFKIQQLPNDSQAFEFSETGADVILISRIKKILYKATFCVHCEVCEVECPTGALSVTPIVIVNKNNCIHCYKCLEFNEKGCITAASVNASYGDNPTINNSRNMKTAKTGINRYNDGMGLRENWLRKYFDTYQTFFNNEEHSLNVNYQIPPFTNWLKEAGILNENDKTISPVGELLQRKYYDEPALVWEIIFIHLCYNSEICNWFQSHLDFYRVYTRAEIDVILQDSYPDLKGRTLSNPLNSLINTFKEGSLSKTMGMVKLLKEEGKLAVLRTPYNEPSLAAVAYSLYKYAEEKDSKSLTITELYSEGQTSGIYRQFGIERPTLERILRTLNEEKNHVLEVQLNLGLDNINLRDDLTSHDILKLML
jgi:3'-phosphoadenosine 5'-phosphosulfate sulfotransferase (PAPS reductase)/FAD synthetase/ferredoxin